MSGYWGFTVGREGEKKPLRFDIECLTSRGFQRADRQQGGNREGWLAGGWVPAGRRLVAISMIFIIKEQRIKMRRWQILEAHMLVSGVKGENYHNVGQTEF